MNAYYMSLCRGLNGYYVKFKADSEEIVREHALQYFGSIWCSIYDEDYFNSRIAANYPTRVINEDKPVELGATWRWD